MRTNFNMQDENITMVKGDTLSFNVIVKDENGEAVTVDSAVFAIRKDATTGTLVKIDLTDGITQDDGVITVRLAPSKTSSINSGYYYYDLRIGIDDDIYTLLRGMILFETPVKTS